MAQVEGVLQLRLGDHHRGPGPQRVPYPQLVDGIGVRGRDVGDDDIRGQELSVHLEVDNAAMGDLVGAYALEPTLHHRGLDHVAVGVVEVELSARGQIRLDAEAHDDETALLLLDGASRL